VSVAVSQDADDASATNARLCAPARFRCVPGIAYRLALVAAGECAAAVSVSHPCEWDLAGGHALLRAAGLDLFALGGAPVRYDADGRCGALDCVGGHPSVAASLCTRDWRSVKRAGEPVRMLRPRADRLAAHPALDRAQGVLLGQVCGDALGAQVEFESAASIARKYPGGVRTLADGGTHHTLAGQATDDSELALALARSLLARGRFDDDHVAAAYVAWAKSGPFDIGHTTSQALRGGTTATAVRIAANPGSTANGALMRVSPLGIFSHGQTPEQSADLARRDASLTHPNVVCADANAIFVASIAHAVRSACGATELHAFATQLAESLAVNADVREALRAATDTRLTDFPSRHPGDVRFSFFAAWRQLLTGNDAADALAEVVGQGRDSDTDAAIAGALFGAVHGAAAFPQQWREQVLTARALEGLPSVHRARPAHYWPVDLLILAEQLLVVGGRAG
jgi:ADP-ribosylglycohydrolase